MGFRGSGSTAGGSVAFAGPSGQIDLGDVNNEGAADTAVRSDHAHAFPGPTGPPGALAGAGAAGGSPRPARQDHTHAHTAAQHDDGGHADLTGLFALVGAPAAAVGDHEALPNPHGQYLTPAEADDAFEALGDTIPKALVDAKGDILVATGADTLARLPAGTDGQIPSWDSAEPTGMKPIDPPGGGVTDHGNLTGLGDTEDHPWALPGSTVVKSTDESVSGSTTLQADNELTMPVAAGEIYGFDLLLIIDHKINPDLKYQLSLPAGATLAGLATFGYQHDGTGLGSQSRHLAANTPEVFDGSSNAVHMVRLTGSIVMGGTAGSLVFEWAQQNNNLDPIGVKAGSVLTVWEAA